MQKGSACGALGGGLAWWLVKPGRDYQLAPIVDVAGRGLNEHILAMKAKPCSPAQRVVALFMPWAWVIGAALRNEVDDTP